MKRISLFFAGLLAMLWAQSALAHGGGTLQIGRAPAGPYLVSVWTNPAAIQAGETLHVTIGVIRPGDATAVLDAGVQVRVEQEGQTLLIAKATTEDALNKLFYETDFPLKDAGVYEITVLVSGMDGSGQASFSLDVKPDSGMGPEISGLIGIVAGSIVGGTAVFLVWRKKRR